jgi:phenol 2-monooxygenase
MAPSFWSLMKRSTTPDSTHNNLVKMAPGVTADSSRSSSFDMVSSVGSQAGDHDGEREPYSFLSDVVVVGAGPSGLMLAANLVRFGIRTKVLDNRSDRTSTGRADGIQPKSIETLRSMRLAEPLLRKGVKVYDIAFWKSTPTKSMHRTAREVHYPPVIDLLDPYLLLVHQGMVEAIFEDDLEERGTRVVRNTVFNGFEYTPHSVRPLKVRCEHEPGQTPKTYATRFLVGCDGAHSRVRKGIPQASPVGASSDAVWAVLDGVLDTDCKRAKVRPFVHDNY